MPLTPLGTPLGRLQVVRLNSKVKYVIRSKWVL